MQQAISNSVLINWGKHTTTSSNTSAESITYSLAYSKYVCVMRTNTSSTGTTMTNRCCSIYNMTKTSFDLYVNTQLNPIMWIAIGY